MREEERLEVTSKAHKPVWTWHNGADCSQYGCSNREGPIADGGEPSHHTCIPMLQMPTQVIENEFQNKLTC